MCPSTGVFGHMCGIHLQVPHGLKSPKIILLTISVPALNKKSPFKDLPEEYALIVKLVGEPMNGLSLDIKKWFDETPDKPFTKRFRGHESKQYLKHFPELMAAVRPHITTTDTITQLFQTCYMSLLLERSIRPSHPACGC